MLYRCRIVLHAICPPLYLHRISYLVSESWSVMDFPLYLVAVSLLPLALGSFPFSSTLTTDPATGQALYQLYWTFDNTQKTITFNVVVRTTGWVGFGLSPDGGMVGSDVVIGWIASDGSSHFHVSTRGPHACCIAVRKYNVGFPSLCTFHAGSLRQCQCSSSDRSQPGLVPSVR